MCTDWVPLITIWLIYEVKASKVQLAFQNMFPKLHANQIPIQENSMSQVFFGHQFNFIIYFYPEPFI